MRACSVDDAVLHLKERDIDAVDGGNILVIPFNYIENGLTAEEIVKFVGKMKSILKEIGYEKSWQIDPYYYDRKKTLLSEMYDT